MYSSVLPQGKNIDGQHIWEPPILNYEAIIGEEYHNKRRAVLEFVKGDVVMATKILELSAEVDLQRIYDAWITDNTDDAKEKEDHDVRSFFERMSEDLWVDFWDEGGPENSYSWLMNNQERMEDGAWKITENEVETTFGIPSSMYYSHRPSGRAPSPIISPEHRWLSDIESETTQLFSTNHNQPTVPEAQHLALRLISLLGGSRIEARAEDSNLETLAELEID